MEGYKCTQHILCLFNVVRLDISTPTPISSIPFFFYRWPLARTSNLPAAVATLLIDIILVHIQYYIQTYSHSVSLVDLREGT